MKAFLKYYNLLIMVNVASVDRVLDDLAVSTGDFETPPTPMLPWWFTPECESQLLMVSGNSTSDSHYRQLPYPRGMVSPVSNPSVQVPVAAAAAQTPPKPQTAEEMKQQLKAQLDYYFSRENLMTDRYLRSQMDNDQYVPIRIIAGFPKVKRITNDINFVVQVLRESTQVQVDEKGERVRAVSKRCTIILREIPESTDEREVASMFNGGPPYLRLSYGLNNSWYVTFETEEATQRAFLHLQNLGKTFNNKPICARIKTGGAPCPERIIPEIQERSLSAVPSDTPNDPSTSVHTTSAISAAASTSTSETFDLGQILAMYGYVPRATFKPGAAVVHVTSTLNTFGGRNIGHRMRGPAAADGLGGSDAAPYTGYYRGSSNRGRGTYSHNHRTYGGGHRDYMNGVYHGNSRRNAGNYQDLHRDNNRLRPDGSHRTRARISRPGYLSTSSNHNANANKIHVEADRNHRSEFRQSSAFDRESFGNRNSQYRQQQHSQQQRSKREYVRVAGNTSNVKCATTLTICDGRTPNGDSQRRSSTCERETAGDGANPISEDGTKSEKSWKPTDDASEYSFEEGAFPSLSDQISMVEVDEHVKVKERPTFSSVAAGRKSSKAEPKERRSYAQTLKQSNGFS